MIRVSAQPVVLVSIHVLQMGRNLIGVRNDAFRVGFTKGAMMEKSLQPDPV